MKAPLVSLFATAGLIYLTACSDTQPAPTEASSTKVNLLSHQDSWKFGHQAYLHTEKILTFGPRLPQSKGLKSTREYIIAQLEQAHWNVQQQTFTQNTPKGPRTFTNLIARYQPDGQNTRQVWRKTPRGLLAAHIDSKDLPNFLGADDAASCAGAILEIAHYLDAHHPEAASQLELVFFDGEEALGGGITYTDGLYGSRYYARALQSTNAKKPQFGIVLDMIGHRNLDIRIPADTPQALIACYKKTAKTLGVEKKFKISHGAITDDHVPLNEIGIPTIDIIGNFAASDWWHTSEDNFSLISQNSLAISTQFTLEFLSSQLSDSSK